MHRVLPIFLMVLFGAGLKAQISFSDRSDLFFNQNITSGVPIGIADMNGDLKDDIIQLDDTRRLYVSYQMEPDSVFQGVVVNEPGGGGGNAWMMSIADVDNDGVNEILAGGVYNTVKLYRYVDTSATYDVDQLPSGSDIFCQASNFADINNDGWLDVFICHDDGESYIWENNKNGTFSVANDMIDMRTTPISDNSGNYGSVWSDFDNDGDLDLYIAKCRQGVGDPTDPRRVNMLMVNDGEHNYTDEAKARNMAIGYQSWTAEFQDIDNDGDFDCFITNHDFQSQLLENDGTGVFTDITNGSGIDVDGLPIQGLMRDFDNDGYVDLIVSGTEQFLYHNNGDKTFTRITTEFSNDDMESISVGDLNDDGFYDIVSGYAEVFNNPTNIRDRLWMNEGNNNNYLKVLLTGTKSNRSASGARLELYGPWGVQTREVRTGESYGISTSVQMIFGMADQTQAEKLIIYWPSGNVDIIENPTANQLLQITESDCYGDAGDISFIGNPVICPGEMLELTAPQADSYLWSNGETTRSIQVSEKGNFWVVVGDNSSCYARTKGVNVSFNPTEVISLSIDGADLFCEGDEVTLSTDTDLDITWSNGETSEELIVTESGNYFVSANGDCGIFNSDTISIEVLDFPNSPMVDNDTIQGAGPATLTSNDSKTHWFADPAGGVPLAIGSTYNIPNVDQTTVFYAENANGDFAGVANVGLEEPVGPNRYTSNQINGGLLFTAEAAFTLKSAKVITDLAGERLVEIRDVIDDSVIASQMVTLEEGEQRIDLNLDVPVGTWFLTTNETTNLNNFGFLTPRMERGNEGVTYPYDVQNVVSITGSNFGSTRYYYFFDWEISTPGTYCPSDRIAASVVVLTSTSTSTPQEKKAWRVFPNPASEQIQVITEIHAGKDVELALYTADGKRVFRQEYQTNNSSFSTSIPVRDLPNGVYQLKIRDSIEFKNKWVVVLR